MSEEKKVHKRKILIRYLILAACILVIAAITVTTVFAVNDWFRGDVPVDNVIDNPDDKNPDVTDPDDNKKPTEPDKPTDADNSFAMPVSTVNVTNSFDFMKNDSLSGQWAFHTGIDLEASAGTSVMACLDGTVESIVRDDHLDGNTLTIKHEDGLKTVYTFINVKDGLKVGDKVKRGDSIGTVAEATGKEYLQGAHLHFEVLKNGEAADPATYLEIEEK